MGISKNAEIHICGLATDFCVKMAAKGFVERNFKVSLIENAVRGIFKQYSDVKKELGLKGSSLREKRA